MFLVNRRENMAVSLVKKTFQELGFKERKHLQEWICKNTEMLGERLLIIQKEFSGFDDTNERLDLLAVDEDGDLVIIENKLDDSGRDVKLLAANNAMTLILENKYTQDTLYQILDYIIPNEDETISEDAFGLLSEWINLVNDKVERTKLNIKMIAFM